MPCSSIVSNTQLGENAVPTFVSTALRQSPAWASETIPGLSVASMEQILQEERRPRPTQLARRFRQYRLLLWSRGLIRLAWGLAGVGLILLTLPVPGKPTTANILVYGLPWLIFCSLLYVGLRTWIPATVAADRVVRAVAFASSMFERNRQLYADEQRRYVLAGVRVGRATFGVYTGSVWTGHSLPRLEQEALRVASNIVWTVPDDFRSWTAAERSAQLNSARRFAALVLAGDLQQAEAFARTNAEENKDLFVGREIDDDRDSYFEAFGPGLANRRMRDVVSGLLPWISLMVALISLTISLTFNLMNASH